MQHKYTVRRYVLFAFALFVNTLGIAYITKAMLDTSPITSVTYVASMFPPSPWASGPSSSTSCSSCSSCR